MRVSISKLYKRENLSSRKKAVGTHQVFFLNVVGITFSYSLTTLPFLVSLLIYYLDNDFLVRTFVVLTKTISFLLIFFYPTRTIV